MRVAAKYTTAKIILGLIVGLSFSQTSFAQSAKKKMTKADKTDKKLDISDLEKKYWAPKDTDFSVVQNRTYSKEKRFSTSIMYGKLINDTFLEGDMLSASANYYFTERMGVEVKYMKDLGLETNDELRAFSNFTVGAQPNHNKMDNYMGVAFNWVPIYAKMSLLGKKIVYFDMSINPGVGMMEYEKQTKDNQFNEKDSSFAYSLGVTQTVFLNKHFSIKLDYTSYWYEEDLLRYNGSSKTNAGSQSNNSSYFTFGIQIFY